MIGAEEALAQGEALIAAAKQSPLRQYRYELGRRGKEWLTAARTIADATEEGVVGEDAETWVIELAGSVVPGMKVPMSGEYRTVIRTMTRDGQLSFHLESDSSPQATYINFIGAASPCVVKG